MLFVGCEDKNKFVSDRITIGMVTDEGGVKDGSYNEFVWSSIIDYARKMDMPGEFYSYVDSGGGIASFENIKTYIKQNTDIIILPGYAFAQPVDKLATLYPHQKFLLLDVVSKGSENVLSALFATNEGSFLAGIAAGFKAKELNTDKIGMIVGMDIPMIREFEAGFEAGAKIVNPHIGVVITEAKSWSSAKKGQELASKMYDSGIKIIYNVAGGTGMGIIQEAIRRAKKGQSVWVVGVDRDQYKDGEYEKNHSVVLTSMMKKLNKVTYQTILSVEKGIFKGGVRVYGLKDNGVGLPDKNPNLKPQWLKIITMYKQKIINGEIKVPKIPSRAL